MQPLKICPDKNDESCIFFVWPLEIVHVIDEESPFYELTAVELPKQKFELVMVLEGTNETSNAKFQARTSYLPNEILWGHRFESMLLFRRDQNRYQVNFSAFHSTFEHPTPTISAKQLDRIMEPYVPPESRTFMDNIESEHEKHLPNGTCLSPSLSLPSTLNRKKHSKRGSQQPTVSTTDENNSKDDNQVLFIKSYDRVLHLLPSHLVG